jgi:hypothetical protein
VLVRHLLWSKESSQLADQELIEVPHGTSCAFLLLQEILRIDEARMKRPKVDTWLISFNEN